MNNRTQLIKLIHVGKRELALDDDTYRLMLSSETGKTSCKQMNIKQLEQVLGAMKSRGFKHHPNARKTPFKRRLSAKSGNVKTQIDKINAIWITMLRHGFIHDGSATALDAYVRRMTRRAQGDGVDHVAWCTPSQAHTVLESLKRWHRRVMVDAIDAGNVVIAPKVSYEMVLDIYTSMRNRRLL